MESLYSLLDDAERAWRSGVRSDQPLWADTPIVREAKPEPGRDWTFKTDLRTIYALIFNDAGLQKKFTDVVPTHWPGQPDDTARDTLHYLLWHELYHPVEAPFSVTGEGNDNKRIHQAIRRGVLQAEPSLSPLEQYAKVSASQNGVKDFVLDNRFYLDNLSRKYVREDIVPVWDFLELQSSPAKANFYTITRYLYGVLYGPQSAHQFFADKTKKKGVALAQEALNALLENSIALPESSSIVDTVKRMFTKKSPMSATDLRDIAQDIRAVFSGNDRYAGIERMMRVLGPTIEKDMPQGRADQQGEGSGSSPQDILQDLLDDMTPQEQQTFLQELANNVKGKDQKPGTKSAAGSGIAKEDLSKLDLLAQHEFYKRSHPEVNITGGAKAGEIVDVGMREQFYLKNSRVLSNEELSKLNLSHIARFQRKTRLPVLMPLENGLFRLNEYELRQQTVRDVKYVDASLDIPDIVELYLDSSGSMNSCGDGFNDGSRWDMLSNVVYGLADALQQGSKVLRKPCSVRIHNFANSQLSSELIPIEEFWRGDAAALKVLFKPENGYNHEDIDIVEHADGKKRAYLIVTDGDLVLSGRTERESKKMKQIAKLPKTTVALFEIGGTYGLGAAVRSDPNVRYYPVHDKNEMLAKGLEVLLSL